MKQVADRVMRDVFRFTYDRSILVDTLVKITSSVQATTVARILDKLYNFKGISKVFTTESSDIRYKAVVD